MRKRSERILNLLDKGPVLKEEREKARKLTREILGFGSFSLRTKCQEIVEESSSSLSGRYGKCNSNFNCLENLDQEEHFVLLEQKEVISVNDYHHPFISNESKSNASLLLG